jgi:spore maturation protein CgeB
VKLVYLTHSLRSCWNHGNAHFLRGVLSELVRRGHDVLAREPEGSWSLDNLLRDAGETGLDAYRAAYPDLRAEPYALDADPAALCDGADVVIVHEWNDPALVAAVGGLRKRGAPFTLLFHDTHHRAVSDPQAIRAFDLDGYDGVLAFGETLAAVYRRWGWGDRVFVWHEAADTHVFRPPESEDPIRRFAPPSPEREGRRPQDDGRRPAERQGLVWIGNWGDDERSAELEAFLFRPAQTVGLALTVHGVRYPAEALAMLARYGVDYRGWLPNAAAPKIFARHLATVHVPRRFYVTALPGIPTIRVFEALACGIPLVSAPWRDSEGLFTIGRDFLMAEDEAGMTRHLRAVRHDPDLRAALVAHGLETIRTRHSCATRVDELMDVLSALRATLPAAQAS